MEFRRRNYKLHGAESFLRSWQSFNQEIPRLSWNPKVYYRVHKRQSLVPILSQMNPIHNFPLYSLTPIVILFFYLCLCLPSGLLRPGFATKTLYAFLISPRCATCPAHRIHLDMITLAIPCEAYKLWGCLLCGSLQSPSRSSQIV
jgi:hypothetical protein